MFRAFRYRLYPNQAQEQQFQRLCGASRFVYNELLSEQIEKDKQFKDGQAEKPGVSRFDLGRHFTRLRAKEGHLIYVLRKLLRNLEDDLR